MWVWALCAFGLVQMVVGTVKLLRGVRVTGRRRPVRIVTLEGLIGCGKTTQLRQLAALNLPHVRVIEEPVAEWEERGLLRAVYEGVLNKAVFQHAVLMSLAAELQSALQDPDVELIISERSPWSNRAVFALTNLTDENELAAYEYTFDKILKGICRRPLHVSLVYLAVDVAAARERIHARGRVSEKTVSDEYLLQLKDAHDALVQEPTRAYPRVAPPDCRMDTCVIDASGSPDTVFTSLCSLLRVERRA